MKQFIIGVILVAVLSSCKKEDKVVTYNVVNPNFSTTKSSFETYFKNADSVRVNHEYSNTTTLLSNSESNSLQVLYYYSNHKNLHRDSITGIVQKLKDAATREITNIENFDAIIFKFYNNKVEVNSRKIILK